MPGPIQIVARSLLVLGWSLALGCGADEADVAEAPATTSGDEPPALSDADRQILRSVLYPGCLEACSAEQSVCTSYCDCALQMVEADAELRDIALNHLEDHELTVELQHAAVNHCGEFIYAHYFVRGCTDACVEEGQHTEAICLSRCQCLYDAVRERHTGSEGLAYVSEQYGEGGLSAEAEAELLEIGAGCYL